jgi:hypothetical protein
MLLFVFYPESNCKLQTMEVLVDPLGFCCVSYGLPLPSETCGFLSLKSSMYFGFLSVMLPFEMVPYGLGLKPQTSLPGLFLHEVLKPT